MAEIPRRQTASRGGHAVVHERDPGGRRVIRKTVAGGATDAAAIEALRHEHFILRALGDVQGVVHEVAFSEREGLPELVLDDVGSHTLAHVPKPLRTGAFLEMAQELATILGAVHDRGILHGRLEPAAILLDANGRPTLAGFESATGAPGRAPLSVEANLGYASPELLGSIARSVDQRADLYSLGAILYELLAGSPPFRSTDPLELAHAHLARKPVQPSLVDPRIPRVLSAIVLALLEKLPEHRYQSAAALAADLGEARRQWLASRKIEPFPLGRLGAPLPPPERLFGRQGEIALLRAAVDRVTQGRSELVLVSGPPGVGKTALVGAVRDEILRHGGFLLEGKCDPEAGSVPYACVVEALRSLLARIDLLPEEKRASLAAAIRAAVGPSGRVLADLLPELAALTGELPPLAALDPLEARDRVHRAFEALLQALAREGSPVVVFLDDLQWSDGGSVDLLRSFARPSGSQHVLVLGALRPGEIGRDHPLAAFLGELERDGTSSARIELGPLSLDATRELLAFALHRHPADVRRLAEVLKAKTAGNPFFIRELLRALWHDRNLTFDPERRQWSWDGAAIERVSVTENVVDLLVASVARLPGACRELLGIAACQGKIVDLGLLAAATERPEAEIGVLLRPALELGLLGAHVEPGAAAGALLRFPHDRVREAVYESIPPADRARLHKVVAQRALELEGAFGDARLFFVATQLNLGVPAITSETERVALAKLDLRAGLRAKASAAYGPAATYLRAGIDALPGSAWQDHRELAFELHREAAACALITGDHAASERLVAEALAHEPSVAERVALLDIRLKQATVRGQWRGALRYGREALRALGHELPETDLDAAIEDEKRAVARLLGDRPIPRLLDAPEMTAPEDKAQMKLLADLTPPAWFLDHATYVLVVHRALRLSLERGTPPGSMSPFDGYASYLSGEDRFASALAFGELAIEHARRSGDRALEAKALAVCGNFVFPWVRPLPAVIPTLRRAFELGAEAGTVRYASYALASILRQSFAAGVPLDEVLGEIEEGMPFLERTGNESMIRNRSTHRQAIRCLQGLTREHSFDDDDFQEASFLEAAKGDPMFRMAYAINRGKVAYLLRDLATAQRQLEIASRWTQALGGHDMAIEYGFYAPLVLLALAFGASPAERASLLARTVDLRRRLAVWAESCPANFLHKKHLVEAEVARLEGRHSDAVDLYEAAIEGAAQEGFLHELALANELAARHALARGRHQAGTLELREAVQAYARWGASGKVKDLEAEFAGSRLLPATATTGAGASVDLLGVLKAAEVVRSERGLDRLLEALVRVCLEIGGADRAALVLEEAGGPVVRALGRGGTPASLAAVRLDESTEVARSVVERVRATRQSFVSDDAPSDPRLPGDAYVAERRPRSLMGVPVLREGRLVATLYLENSLTTHAFSAARVRVLDLLSSHLATSLENRLLIERLEREVGQRAYAEANVRFLANAGELLASSLDVDATLAHVAHLAVPCLASICCLDLVDASGELRRVTTECEGEAEAAILARLAGRSPSDPSSPRSFSERVLATGEPLVISELDDAAIAAYGPGRDGLELARSLGIRSILSVPVAVHGKALGVLTLLSSHPSRRYGPDMVALVQELARRIGVAIENARLYGEARDAVRLREEFLSIAAHELYTPITSLGLMLRGLETGRVGSSPESLRGALALAERQVRRLTGLIDGLLNVSRIQAGKLVLDRQRVDLALVVAEAAARLAVDLESAGSSLAVNARPGVVGSWDPTRLDQVVTNLLSNAIKFGSGKPIELEVGQVGKKATLVVRDHGIGIPENDLVRIFAPFERAVSTREYGGLGLGLFIVRSIVEAHGGSVRARNAVGQGTTIEVELPLEVEVAP